jgi:hypothetical protein
MSKEKQQITWSQLSNLFPHLVTFVGMLVTIVISYAGLNTRITVLENKMDILIANQDKLLTKYSDVEARYGEIAIRVSVIESKIK